MLRNYQACRSECMTKVQNLKAVFITTVLSAVLVAASGCGSKDGFAPSSSPVITDVKSKVSVFMKNGSTVLTSNGWNLDMDTTEPIANLTTTNGWKVEVKYE